MPTRYPPGTAPCDKCHRGNALPETPSTYPGVVRWAADLSLNLCNACWAATKPPKPPASGRGHRTK